MAQKVRIHPAARCTYFFQWMPHENGDSSRCDGIAFINCLKFLVVNKRGEGGNGILASILLEERLWVYYTGSK